VAQFYLIPKINYFKPKNLDEALKLLSKLEEARVIAGGTDLIVDMKTGRTKPKNVIDISSLGELKYIKLDSTSIRIGAATTLQEILESKIIVENVPVLAEAISNMGSWHLRNVATIGGNLCNASPAADTAPPLLVLNAEVKLRSLMEERIVPISKFFHGPRSTELRANEIMTEIVIPRPPKKSGMKFLKLGRRSAHTLSIVAVATLVTVDKGRFNDVRISLNAVAPTPIRAYKTEEALKGEKVEIGVIEDKMKMITEGIKPITDVRASAEYRREMSIILARDAIFESLKQLGFKLEVDN